jgi:hypothetical protein
VLLGRVRFSKASSLKLQFKKEDKVVYLTKIDITFSCVEGFCLVRERTVVIASQSKTQKNDPPSPDSGKGNRR